jgi:hypothetical protein
MTTVKCDLCGMDCTEKNQKVNLWSIKDTGTLEDPIRIFDLCPACYGKLLEHRAQITLQHK